MRQSKYEHLGAPSQFSVNTSRRAAAAALELLGGFETSGDDNIKDRQGSYVQASIHRSMLDILVLGVAAHRIDGQQLHYIAKNKLDKSVAGWWMERAGSYFVNRSGLTAADLEYIDYLHASSAAIATFPEGHRNSGPLTRQQVKSLIMAPIVFEHGLETVAVGIDGTEPGDVGTFQAVYGPSIAVEKVAIDPQVRRELGGRAVIKAIGGDAIRAYTDDLFRAMSQAQLEAKDLRAQRLARKKPARLAVYFNQREVKPRPPLSKDEL